MAQVYAIRATDGSQVWRFPEKPTRTMYFAAPVLVENQLIVGDYQKTLQSFRRKLNERIRNQTREKRKRLG